MFEKPISTEKYSESAGWFKDAPQEKDQVAIIGFWKLDEKGEEYHCYNFFYVPNPCVRELGRSERPCYIHGKDAERTTISVCQVLFKGEEDDLFLLFNPGKIDEKTLEPDKNTW